MLNILFVELLKILAMSKKDFIGIHLRVTNLMHGQSPDIALGTDNFGAGDQGIMFGYACNQTDNYMPAPAYYSHRIVEILAVLRKQGISLG